MDRYLEHEDLTDAKRRLRDRARAYNDLGMHKEAIAEYQKLIQLDSGDPGSYLGLGISFEKNKEIDKSIECYRNALKLFPNDNYLYTNLGYSYDKYLKRPDMAMVCYEKALEIDPQDYWALNDVGVLLRKAGEFKKAFCYFKKAYDATKADKSFEYTVHHNFAWAYYQRKSFKKAWQLYNKLAKDYPDKVSVYTDFACVNYRIGKFKDALKLIDKMLYERPNNRHCRRLYEIITRKLNKGDY